MHVVVFGLVGRKQEGRRKGLDRWGVKLRPTRIRHVPTIHRRMLEEEEEEEDGAGEAYTAKDLAGLKVAHDMEELGEGQEVSGGVYRVFIVCVVIECGGRRV